jgi:hypothetical protein
MRLACPLAPCGLAFRSSRADSEPDWRSHGLRPRTGRLKGARHDAMTIDAASPARFPRTYQEHRAREVPYTPHGSRTLVRAIS